MANFKRGRAKNARAGCLLCKPHKANGEDRRTLQEQRAEQPEPEDDGEMLPGVICRVSTWCPIPEKCQERCWEEDLADAWKTNW